MKTNFYKEFCKELKITPQNNKIKLESLNPATDTWQKQDWQIFTEDKHGNVDILVYTLNGRTIQVKHPKANPEKDVVYNNRSTDLMVKRLAVPEEYTDPKTGKTEIRKYKWTPGAKTFPFFPPLLRDFYEKQKPFDTLILTEGYKKAWYASLFGLPVVGLASITCYKDRDTKAMYEDVITLIKTCKVKNVIMLYDGDCFNISTSQLNNGTDLRERPIGFFNSCKAVRELLKLKDHPLDVYFGHINSESVESHPKGLDDIFLAKPGEENELVSDILTLNKPGQYFTKINATTSLNKVSQLFRLEIAEFYKKHAEIIGNKPFIYHGTTYFYDEEKPGLTVIIPAEAKKYFQVGDDYFKIVPIPNIYGADEDQHHRRNIGTIIRHHGKDFIKHIPIYEAFCNVPDNLNFSQVINNCFNLYQKIEHEPEPGDCPISLDFVKHIFGEQYELGLDYIQLLYQKPTQILPILCLVSKENKTGKSTFIKWIKHIFGQNATVVGNAQFESNFNSSWTAKLLVMCEELFIKKPEIMEKLKSLSTATFTQMEFKGKDAKEVAFFGKFILASNKEENFIYVTENDIRYWVRKIPLPTTENINLEKQLIDEIPAFLHFLNNRKMHTQNETRMWFRESLLETDALAKLKEANRPAIEKIIVERIKELFIETGETTLNLPKRYIKEVILKSNNKYEDHYIGKSLNNLGVEQYKNEQGKIVYKRFSVPYYQEYSGQCEMKEERGRPYVFERDKFITQEELEQYEIKTPDETPETNFNSPYTQTGAFD